MAEYDNAGFPLTYCLLSTATAIDQGKRTKALSGWAISLRDKYGVCPIFVHSDKDMAEIGCAKLVWPEAKINLCWWHLHRAIRTRLAKAKLSTMPYNFKRAKKEYGFIDVDFIPPGTRVDIEDYEGGSPDLLPPLATASTTAPRPPTNPGLAATQPQPPPLGNVTNSLRIRVPLANVVAASCHIKLSPPKDLAGTQCEYFKQGKPRWRSSAARRPCHPRCGLYASSCWARYSLPRAGYHRQESRR